MLNRILFNQSFIQKLKRDENIKDILKKILENSPSDDIRKLCVGISYALDDLQKRKG